ncbi:MAG TPA: dephospho-CoA kinase, partial [Steroidobacteraceae bacterium]|nr:dephospho-CoA kinase [Steroidobacteraceae bacterium]
PGPDRPARLKRPLKIGLTGGIASGKSTVGGLFAALGVAVIDTDQIARDVVAPGTALQARVLARFGAQLLTPTGELDRRALRERVFADAAERQALEELIHPAIMAELSRRSVSAGGAYQLLAIPLLVEHNLKSSVDRVLLVDCSPDLQLRRVQVRDGVTVAEAQAVLAAQASRAARLAVADDVIVNDGDLERLREQVEILHSRYGTLARETPRQAQ